jgi:hypothetical protein
MKGGSSFSLPPLSIRIWCTGNHFLLQSLGKGHVVVTGWAVIAIYSLLFAHDGYTHWQGIMFDNWKPQFTIRRRLLQSSEEIHNITYHQSAQSHALTPLHLNCYHFTCTLFLFWYPGGQLFLCKKEWHSVNRAYEIPPLDSSRNSVLFLLPCTCLRLCTVIAKAV